MGMFDYVRIYDGYTEVGELVPNEHFYCPRGHNLKCNEFQTKDFYDELGMVEVYPDAVRYSPRYSEFKGNPAGTYNIYTQCETCTQITGLDKYVYHWCEFTIELDADWNIVSVKWAEDQRY